MLARMVAVRPLRALPTKSEFLRLSTMRFISRSDVVVDGHRAIGREDVQLLPLSQDIVDRFGQAFGSAHLQAHLHTPVIRPALRFPVSLCPGAASSNVVCSSAECGYWWSKSVGSIPEQGELGILQ
jgi:hypothetical protein